MAIHALGAITVVGGIAIAILLYYHRQTAVIWVTFVTIVSLVLVVCLRWQTNVLIKEKEFSSGTIEPQLEKQLQAFPNLDFRITDSLYDEKEKLKSGEIVYEGLITLPFSETLELNDLMLKVKFPMAIKSCSIVDQRGVDSPRVRIGPVALSKRVIANEETTSTFYLDIEIERVKPGAFFRFLVTTEFLANRQIDNPIQYEGYCYWMQEEGRHKEKLTGRFSPQTEKAEPLTIEKWDKLGKMLAALDGQVGSLIFWTENRYWYVRNNVFIEFFPRFESQNFGLHIFRDTDNALKCKIRTPSHGLVTLAYLDFDIEQLIKFKNHPSHVFGIIWSTTKVEFYVDGLLVDKHYTHKHKEMK